MTSFVAGATGYVGREVVRALVARGERTIAHVRPDSARLDEWRARFAELGAELDTTPWTRESMTARLRELAPDVVFALLGTTRKRMRGSASADESYETVDYGLTALLVDAAAAAGSAPRFVYLSSVGVSDRSRGSYLRARARAERAVREAGLPFTIARPSFITGPDRDEARWGERAGAAVSDGMLALAGALGASRLRARFRSTTNVELADDLVRLAFDPDARDQIVEGAALHR